MMVDAPRLTRCSSFATMRGRCGSASAPSLPSTKSWLRQIAAGKRSSDMSADEWRARVALMVPYLEHHEPLVAEIAYGELAAAPYAALLAAKPRLDAPAIRRWLADPRAHGETTYVPAAARHRR